MSAHPRPNMMDTKDGPVDLGMLVGALLRRHRDGLLRSAEIITINDPTPAPSFDTSAIEDFRMEGKGCNIGP